MDREVYNGNQRKKVKGIILAGGSGTRLYPITRATSKQLVNVYDKPLIYYPLCTLMEMHIKQILVVTTPEDLPNISRLLGSGRQWGISLTYAVQDEPRGIADGLIIAKYFTEYDPCIMILGDNIFMGPWMNTINVDIIRALQDDKAAIVCTHVKNPEAFGVLTNTTIEIGGHTQSEQCIVEKPEIPGSNWAVTGLYAYPSGAWFEAEKLKPSDRGELEITDLNNIYLTKYTDGMKVLYLHKYTRWMDVGTVENLSKAGMMIRRAQKRSVTPLFSPEEVAVRLQFIKPEEVQKNLIGDNAYIRRLKKTI